MAFKEEYLSYKVLDHDIAEIRAEIVQSISKQRKWDATMPHSALIVTDLQNYFLSPGSHAFIPSAEAIIPNIQKLIEIFRNNDRPVIFTKHINDENNAQSMNYWWKDLVREETPSAGLYGNLCEEKDYILLKHQYDAFYGTELENILRSHGVIYPVICGVMANLCCETTTRSAFVRGFRPVLPIDATAAYTRDFHIATFRNLAFGFSPLMTTREVIDQLKP
jgi:nicotinamidase-related amidase